MNAADLATSLMFSVLKMLGFVWVVQQGAEITGLTRYMKIFYLIAGSACVFIGYDYVKQFMAIAKAASSGTW